MYVVLECCTIKTRLHVENCSTVQHKTLVGRKFCTARKLVRKILAADHTNNSSVFEFTRTYNIW